MPHWKRLISTLPNVRRSRELNLIRNHLRELCRTSASTAELLEELIHSCDEFMCWAEEVKKELIDQRDELLGADDAKPALRLRAE